MGVQPKQWDFWRVVQRLMRELMLDVLQPINEALPDLREVYVTSVLLKRNKLSLKSPLLSANNQ
jgi:hypothetical protein